MVDVLRNSGRLSRHERRGLDRVSPRAVPADYALPVAMWAMLAAFAVAIALPYFV